MRRRTTGCSGRSCALPLNRSIRQQQPVVLLERIIQASSNEGDVVLVPFCGCGTPIAIGTAAQKLNRQWIGIDVTHLAVGLMKLRLKDSFGMIPIGTKTIHHREHRGRTVKKSQ